MLINDWLFLGNYYACAMITEGEIAKTRANLGKRIRDLRESRGWSQYQFAEIVPIDRTYLIGVEKGRRNIAIDNLIKISRGLGVSVSELCHGIEYDSGQFDH